MPFCAECGHESTEPFRFCPECGAAAALSPGTHEQRKVVTVLFCDLVGSTEIGERLDPEPLRDLLRRYYEQMTAIVEGHGGTVEKFIGDAVMAVFGVPVVREDDALRAVRAAMEMREALPALGLAGRLGVNTGEVVTATPQQFVTGDAVNVAARLEQAAQAGEVLVGEHTFRIVRNAVDAEALEPIRLKGKAEPVQAFRVVSVRGADIVTRRFDTRLVGREAELGLLRDSWNRVVAESSCRLVTLVGQPGVGKSRLAAELLATIQGAQVVRGRCISYGDGITYWPVVEVVKQVERRLPALHLEQSVRTVLESLLRNEAGSSADDIAWAFRKLLEALAAERPLLVLFDDIQWGEDRFLDLVEHVSLLAGGVPFLLLCLARPELPEKRPGWPIDLRLEPLSSEQSELLIAERLDDGAIDEGLRGRIVQAAGGNPLFVEEMIAMVRERGGTDVSVPPTIHALLAARIDGLAADERGVLERGAVEGEVFHRGAVQALAPERLQVTSHLTSLVRKELVRPDRAQLRGEDAFRFRHLLIRDAAYDALPKSTRAELHERFADWLSGYGHELVERDEILGYHLEQAYRYRVELGEDDEHTATLARRASELLAEAGNRAGVRHDFGAVVNLLGRALDLLPAAERPVELEGELIEALTPVAGPAVAAERAAAVVARCRATGDERGELLAELWRLGAEAFLAPQEALDPLTALGQKAVEVFERSGDDVGLLWAWRARVETAHARSLFGEKLVCVQRALELARRLRDERLEQQMQSEVLNCDFYGPTPAAEAILRADDSQQLFRTGMLSVLAAMQGRFDDAHQLLAAAFEELVERGMTLPQQGHKVFFASVVYALEGDYEAAERSAREGCQELEKAGADAYLSTTWCMLGQYLYALGRYAEAQERAEAGRTIGAPGDALTQMLWRQVSAKVLARRGDHADAVSLARDAIAEAHGTEMLDATADAYADLAEVLQLGGDSPKASQATTEALSLYERKGNLVMANRMRTRLQDLERLASVQSSPS